MRDNLILLGRWDAAGRHYHGGNGEIMLITKNRMLVVQGIKIHNHLYHMKMDLKLPNQSNKLPIWETWHRCFGHVECTRLQKLLDGKMVEKFTVDKDFPKPDCIACTEAKHHVTVPKIFNQKDRSQ